VSEQTETAVAGEHTEQGQEASKFEAITSQEDFDKAIQARIARERAKIPTDYEELKAQAAKFQEIQESQKTEAEKVAERLAAAEKRAVELEAKATRAEVAAAKGVPVGLLSGGTKEELEASADALIQFKGESGSTTLHVPNEGKSPTAQVDSKKQFAKNLFGRSD
jgi:DNA repair exonuclease SbcCD ATPase subunit